MTLRLVTTALLVTLAACDTSEPARYFSADRAAAFADAVEAERADLGVAGALVGVWIGDEEWVEAFGTADSAGTVPITRDMHTRIGSITKTFTGELILRLADEGVLSLSDPVGNYLPDAPNADVVTLRHLARMESGYATYTFDPDFQDTLFDQPQTAWSPMEAIEIAWDNTALGCPHAPSYCFEPGTAFAYCNTNLAMLGLVAEIATGESLATLFETRLFEPLGMTGTRMPADATLPDPHLRGYTMQGLPDGATLPQEATGWNPTWGFGTGDLISTLDDLRTWAEVAGKGSGLSETMRTERFRLSTFPPATPERAYSFALGYKVGYWGHTGSLPGYTTSISYDPTTAVTIVVLTNLDQAFRASESGGRAYTPADEIADRLVALLRPERE